MDLRAPLLAALTALAAGCLGSFEAPASPDLALPPLVDLAVAPADLTLRRVVILPAAPSDGAMAMASANPRQRFDLTVAALLQARCAPCHGKEGGLGPALLKPPAYDSLLAWPRIVTRDPSRSLLVAKGPHSEVVWWSPDEALTLLDWLGMAAPDLAMVVAPPPDLGVDPEPTRGGPDNTFELFRRLGCADCHRPSLPVDDPLLVLASGRRLDLRRRLSPSGRPPYEVAAVTDLLAHHLGAAVADGEPGGSDRFVTAPLWGLSSRGPFLHDGRAATIQEAILAHGGEAEPARSRYLALGSDETDLLLFLHTPSRPPVLSWVR